MGSVDLATGASVVGARFVGLDDGDFVGSPVGADVTGLAVGAAVDGWAGGGVGAAVAGWAGGGVVGCPPS